MIAKLEATPQAVWFDGTTASGAQQKPGQVTSQVRRTMLEAAAEQAVPVLVPYDIPGRDCSPYSAGGALDDADYQAWISGFAHGIGRGKAVVVLEPDSLANLPSDCAVYGSASYPYTDAERLADIKYAVTALEADPNVSVYLDGGHSAWQSVGTMADPTSIGIGGQPTGTWPHRPTTAGRSAPTESEAIRLPTVISTPTGRLPGMPSCSERSARRLTSSSTRAAAARARTT